MKNKELYLVGGPKSSSGIGAQEALLANEDGDRLGRLLALLFGRNDLDGALGVVLIEFAEKGDIEDARLVALVGLPDVVLGPVLVEHGDPFAVADGAFAEVYRQTPLNTIYGGTVEILRSLIAEIELGLPKSR